MNLIHPDHTLPTDTSGELLCIHKEYQPNTWHVSGLWWDAIYFTALYNALDGKTEECLDMFPALYNSLAEFKQLC